MSRPVGSPVGADAAGRHGRARPDASRVGRATTSVAGGLCAAASAIGASGAVRVDGRDPGRGSARDDRSSATHHGAAALRPVADRPHQRLVLRAAEPRPRRHLRHAQHRQFRPWRLLHGRRLRRLFPAALRRRQLLGRADPVAAHRRRARRAWSSALHAATHRRPRPSLRPAAHLRARAGHPGPVPEPVRLLRQALSGADRAAAAPSTSASCSCRNIAPG